MRYRFSARTGDGELRNGKLEAADEASARAQLARRGMTPELLEEDLGEAPVHVATSDLPLGAAPARRQRWWESIDWGALDKRKLALLSLLVLTCLGSILGVVRWIFSDRTYHLHLTGQVKISSRKPLKPDTYGKLSPRLWLPQLRWVVNPKGEVFAKDAKGVWQKLSRRASFDCQFGTEGMYTIDINLAMPSVPERGMLYFPAGRFRRVSRQFAFRVRKNVFEGEVPTMTLIPHTRSKKVRATKAVSKK